MEGTICKQFVPNAKNRKNLKPCRGFKSFRSLVFRIQFMKKCVFGSSNPSTRRKIENGSMEIRKIGQKDLVFRFAQLQVFLDGLTPSFASQNEKRCPTAALAAGELCEPTAAGKKTRECDYTPLFFVMPLQNRSIQGYRTKTVRVFCCKDRLIPW